ncbi:MAG: Ldh family oxidoreductase [bacterium]
MLTRLVDGPSLRRFYADAFRAAGVPAAHAEIASDGIYYADRHGLDSHGVAGFLRIYLRMVESAEVDARAVPRVVAGDDACATVDGCNGFGFIAGHFAMDEAIERARCFGIGAVAVRNSSHAGAMGFYAHQAREAGMLGVALTNLGREGMLPPPGGVVPLVGTNVLAVAAPTKHEAPFSLDMSTAVVSAGRVRLAARRREPVPDGWLADAEGRSVLDPTALDRGTAILRFLGGAVETGAHKGFGLALVADILCGVLSGAAVGPTRDKLDGSAVSTGRKDADIGHFFLALRIGAFGDEMRFAARLDEMLGTVRQCPPSRAGCLVTYPGMPEAAIAAERVRAGIPMEPALLDGLVSAAARLDVSPPQELPAQ